MKYKEFDDWFWEIENYATRGERFYDELKAMDEKRALEWLKAAWECARDARPRVRVTSTSNNDE